MQTATDPDKSNVWYKSIMGNAPEVSFSIAIKRASESSPQSTQVCNNPKRTKVSAKMERAARTSLMQPSHLMTFNARARVERLILIYWEYSIWLDG